MHSTAALLVRLRCLFDSSSVHRWSSMGSSRRPHDQLRLRRARHSRSRRPPCATCHRARRQALLDGIELFGIAGFLASPLIGIGLLGMTRSSAARVYVSYASVLCAVVSCTAVSHASVSCCGLARNVCALVPVLVHSFYDCWCTRSVTVGCTCTVGVVSAERLC